MNESLGLSDDDLSEFMGLNQDLSKVDKNLQRLILEKKRIEDYILERKELLSAADLSSDAMNDTSSNQQQYSSINPYQMLVENSNANDLGLGVRLSRRHQVESS